MQRPHRIDRFFNNPLAVLGTISRKRLADCAHLLSRFRTQSFRQSLRDLVGGLFAWRGPDLLSYQSRRRGTSQGRSLVSRRRIFLEPLEQRALLTWIGATSGNTMDARHDYNNTANWAGGNIDDSFNGVNFLGNTTLYFSANHTTVAAGLNLNYTGNANLTLQPNTPSPIVLTLNGGVSGNFGGPSIRLVSINGFAANNPISIVLPSGNHSFDVASPDTLSLGAVVSGPGDVTKAGGGTLVFTQANSYGGATDINAGTLRTDANNAIPATSAVSLVAGANLTLNRLSNTIGSLSSGTGVVGSVNIFNGGSGYSTAPTVTFSGGGGSGATGTAMISPAGAVTSVTITNPGSGYTSVPTVSFSAPPGGGIIAGGTAVISAGTVTLFGNTLTTGGNNASTTFFGNIAGSTPTSTLIKTGSGTFILAHNNNNYRNTFIEGGTIQIGIGGNSGTIGTGPITNNADLIFNRSTLPALQISGVISGTGNLTVAQGQMNLTAANTYEGTTTINPGGQLNLGSSTGSATGSLNPISAIVNNGRLGFLRTNTITQGVDFANAISGTGSLLKGAFASGTVILNEFNTYSSTTDISSGVVQINSIQNIGVGPSSLGEPTTLAGSSIALGTVASTVTANLVYVGTGNTTDRRINLNGTTAGPPMITQSGTGHLKFTGPIVSAPASKTLTLSGSTIGTGEIASSIPNNSGTNRTSLTKSGTGTWTLSGANTYTGDTTINGGTLRVMGPVGSILSSSTTVNSTGTLAGTGTTGGVTVTSGGTLAPGDSPGILNTGNLTLNAGSTFRVELNGTSPGSQYDQADVAGGVTLNDGILDVSLGYTPAEGDSFTVINNDGADEVMGIGTFKVGGVTIPDGGSFMVGATRLFINYGAGSDNNDVVLTVDNNDPPQANPDSADANEDGPAVSIDLTANDTDPDAGDDLEIVSINTTGTLGQVVLNADNDSVTYDPNGQFEALAAGETVNDTFFFYTIDDGNGEQSTSSVAVTIHGQNDAPVAEQISQDSDEDGPTVTLAADFEDVDASDTHSFSIDTTGTLGAVTNNGDGTFAYDPNGQFEYLASGKTATDSFTYTVDDGNGGTDTATAIVTIHGQNDAPTAENVSADANEDGPAVTLTANFNDIDSDTHAFSVDTTGTLGNVTNNGDGTFSYDPNGQFEYLAVGETATDTFTYTVDDGNGGTATATVTVTIHGENDEASVAADNAAVTIGEGDTALNSGTFEDVDLSDNVTITASVGSIMQHTGNAGSWSWSYATTDGPDDSQIVTITADDGHGGITTTTFELTVNNVAPTATDNSYITPQAKAVSGNVFTDGVDDSDPAGANDPLTAFSHSGPANGTLVLDELTGAFTYTPGSTFSGSDSFTYTISDGDGGFDTATVTITVSPAAEGSVQTVPDSCCGGDAVLVTGTPGDDLIVVSPGSGATLHVTTNGVATIVPTPSGRVIVIGGDGDDNIQIAGAIANQVWLYGEAGDDRLNAGNGGGLLIGGAGSDELLGGGGRDVIVGGEGADRLIGNSNDDILIASLTNFDDWAVAGHETFWCDVLKEWNSTNTFTQRVQNLRNGSGETGYTGPWLLPQVVDDCMTNAIDFLNGSAGYDWIIYEDGEDKVVGQAEATDEPLP